MAKIVKFPLKLADGTNARSLEELREHGDVASVLGHYREGTLVRWLKAFGQNELAEQVVEHRNVQVDSSKANLQGIFSLLGISLDEAAFNEYCEKQLSDKFVFSDAEDGDFKTYGQGVSIKEKLVKFFPTTGTEADILQKELAHWEITETELDGDQVQINYTCQKHSFSSTQQMKKGDDLYAEIALALKWQMRPLRAMEQHREIVAHGNLVYVEGDGDNISNFYIGKYLVTQKEWKEVMGYNPSKILGDLLPVTNVSVNEMCEYCNKRSEMEGLTPVYVKASFSWRGDSSSSSYTAWSSDRRNSGYRIAGEKQWFYAAKGGKHQDAYAYSGSDEADEVAWHRGNSEGKTHEVGTKAPNSLGIYDMCGNVWEVCWSHEMEHYRLGGSYWESVKTIKEMEYDSEQEYGYREIQNNDKDDVHLGFRVTRPALR